MEQAGSCPFSDIIPEDMDGNSLPHLHPAREEGRIEKCGGCNGRVCHVLELFCDKLAHKGMSA
jgi:hypothetical protein